MKKIIAIALLCAMLCLCFVACGGDEDKGDNAAQRDIYNIVYNGVTIKLGDNAASVIDKLGEATSVKEIGDCGGFGAQVKYTYPSVVVYTLKNDEGETIDQIDLLDDIVTTPEGIYIGSSASDVENKYGEADSVTDSAIIYNDGNCFLKFGIKNGEVVSVSILRETN